MKNKIVDFSDCKVNIYKNYGGANGSKLGVFYEDKSYMLKFQPYIKNSDRNTKYSNSCLSEYLSCKIIKDIGLDVQEVILGTYKGKDVVACLDFTENGKYILNDFIGLKNAVLDSNTSGSSTELKEVLNAIDKQKSIDKKVVLKRFWEMFVVDTFLGNFDRHNGNWGFLASPQTEEYKLAPIFDCGSCLYPQVINSELENILNSEEEIKKRVEVFPNSALKNNGIKINYSDFWKNTDNLDALNAFNEIYPKISLKKIHALIDNTPIKSELLRSFLKTMIDNRFHLLMSPIHEMRFSKEIKSADIKDTTTIQSKNKLNNEIK